jgi:hypothetical protein
MNIQNLFQLYYEWADEASGICAILYHETKSEKEFETDVRLAQSIRGIHSYDVDSVANYLIQNMGYVRIQTINVNISSD